MKSGAFLTVCLALLWVVYFFAPRFTSRETPSPGGQREIIRPAVSNADITVADSDEETLILSTAFPAGYARPGTCFRIKARGTIGDGSSAPVATWNVRLGITNTSWDTLIGTWVPSFKGTNRKADCWELEALATVTTARSINLVGSLSNFMGPEGAFQPPIPYSRPEPVPIPDVANPLYLSVYFRFGTKDVENTITFSECAVEVVKK